MALYPKMKEEEIDLIADSNLTRLEQLQKNVDHAKRLLRYWEKLVTKEVILINGAHYGESDK